MITKFLYHLIWIVLSLGPVIVLADSLPFFNLSGIDGLMELPRVQDASSSPIYIPGFLIYGDNIVKSVYVSRLQTHTTSNSYFL